MRRNGSKGNEASEWQEIAPFLKVCRTILEPSGDLLEGIQRVSASAMIGSRQELLSEWRSLLILAVSQYLDSPHARHKLALLDRYRSLLKFPYWDGDQLLCSLRALCAALLGMDAPALFPIQYAQGALCQESSGRWVDGFLPDLSVQAELSSLWALLALAQNSPELMTKAKHAAEWSHRIEGYSQHSTSALFAREDRWNPKLQSDSIELASAISGLLLAVDAPMQCSLQGIDRYMAAKLLLAESLADRYQENLECPVVFSPIDDELALICSSSERESACLSLCGAGTGFGTVRWGEIEICAFAPSRGLLGTTEEFGIFRAPRSAENLGPVSVQQGGSESVSRLSGRVGLAQRMDSKSRQNAFSRVGVQPAVAWCDVELKWDGRRLELLLEPIFDPTERGPLWLQFFLKAEACEVLLDKVAPSCAKLQGYEGPYSPLHLSSGQDVIRVDANSACRSVHIRPLSGERSFWGANYLVAFHLDRPGVSYHCSLQWESSQGKG